jgi:ATP-dependent helicase HrpB
MARLETVRVSGATAEQRRGRAGRTGPGVCYRMWTTAEHAGLVPQDTPEILQTDLAPLALELANWGIENTAELSWIDPPPGAALRHARELLLTIGAIDPQHAITPHGRAMTNLSLHPRLAHMVITASLPERRLDAAAYVIAALLSERDLLRDWRDPDFRLRIDLLRRADPRSDEPTRQRVLREISNLADRRTDNRTPLDDAANNAGLLLAFAYPDRVAIQRGKGGRYLLRNGRGAFCDAPSLASSEFIVVAELDDSGRDARIRLAAPLDRADLENAFHDEIISETRAEWDDDSDSARAYRVRALGAIVLERVRITSIDSEIETQLLLAAIRRRGISSLPWTDDAVTLRHRIQFARAIDETWPDVSDARLGENLDWLAPFLAGSTSLGDLAGATLRNAIASLLTYEQTQELDALAPSHFAAPTGTHVEIDYSDPDAPYAAVRLQEMFGVAETPRVGRGRVPVTLHLLSPARRPIQVTRDLAGFWKGSYFEVRKDMRGRYPKHEWPLDPLHAAPTRRAKPRPDKS